MYNTELDFIIIRNLNDELNDIEIFIAYCCWCHSFPSRFFFFFFCVKYQWISNSITITDLFSSLMTRWRLAFEKHSILNFGLFKLLSLSIPPLLLFNKNHQNNNNKLLIGIQLKRHHDQTIDTLPILLIIWNDLSNSY